MEAESVGQRGFRLRGLLAGTRQGRPPNLPTLGRLHRLNSVAGLAGLWTVVILAVILFCSNYTYNLSPPKRQHSRAELSSGSIAFPQPEVPVAQSMPHLSQDHSRCPLQYDRIPYEDVRDWKVKPYLLGGTAKPACHNCDRDEAFSHFCKYESHGPTCPDWLKWQLTHDWIERAELGAPGARERLTMTPCDLFPFFRNRTIWLMGDSLTLNWHKAVLCFLYEFWDMGWQKLEGTHPQLPDSFQGWCNSLAQGARVCFLRANKGEQFAQLLPLLPDFGAKPTDLMVLNFAIWLNDRPDYRASLGAFAKAFYKHREQLPEAIWRDAASQHFHVPTGDYNGEQRGEMCAPIEGVELQPDNSLLATDASKQELADGGWRNAVAIPVARLLGLPVVHTWNESVSMWQYHVNDEKGKLDCTHTCHPSTYQDWIFKLYLVLRELHPELAGPAWL